MEPFEKEELTDRELDGLLQAWKTPPVPDRIRKSLFPSSGARWFCRLWRVSIRVPLPVALGLILVLGVVATRRPQPPPPLVVVKTERVEVPVVRERVVTKLVYRQAPVNLPAVLTFRELKPVAELRPRIIRSAHVEN
jgi:hypothetical protein